jgi:hypothetical protein
MKKLYEVNVEFTYYALAESEMGALSYCSDALSDESSFDVADAMEITDANHILCWPSNYLIYGAGSKDVTLGQALNDLGLPSVGEIRKLVFARTMRTREIRKREDKEPSK